MTKHIIEASRRDGTRLGALLVLFAVAAAAALWAIQGGTSPAGGPAEVRADHKGTGMYLRHVDVDRAAEHLAQGGHEGVLPNRDDRDEATGALHTVCVFGNVLRAQDNQYITWEITATVGNPTVNPAGGQKVSGQTLTLPLTGNNLGNVPCVQWRSANPGDQTIVAHVSVPAEALENQSQVTAAEVSSSLSEFCWDEDLDPCDFRVYYDGPSFDGGTLPLIKEWNPIEFTKIVGVSGVVGSEWISENTDELENWVSAPTAGECIRDQESATATKPWCGSRANLDVNAGADPITVVGQTIFITGQLLLPPMSFIDYTIGSHPGYAGALDGAKQTYSMSGSTCGSLRVEDPVDGDVHHLWPGGSTTVLTSDKGVGFTVLFHDEPGSDAPSFEDFNCNFGDRIVVTISTQEDVLLRSLGYDVPDEKIVIEFAPPPQVNKQPILAWAGQRVVLEHDWSIPWLGGERLCPWGGFFNENLGVDISQFESESFFVHYTKQAQGPGGFTAGLESEFFGGIFATSQHEQSVVVWADGWRPETGVNTDCISTALYESQDPGEVDITANVVLFGLGGAGGFLPLSQQVVFLVYFMKLEDVQLGIISDANLATGNPWLRTGDNADTTERTLNVEAGAWVRARVRGWFQTSNPTARPAGLDSNGNVLPAGRWVMPDDWRQLAGGALAEQFRPNYDIMISPQRTYGCNTGTNGAFTPDTCTSSSAPGVASGTQTHSNVVGPFSLVDGPNPGDSLAPASDGGFRNAWLHDGVIDATDAPMPPALVTFRHSGSGFLVPAFKTDVYSAGKNPFYAIEIPAEPWISQLNADGSGYRISTWNNGEPYELWDAVAKATPVGNGWRTLSVYSDNHGEAIVHTHGNVNLTFEGCTKDRTVAGGNVVEIVSGWFCAPGAVVGRSSVDAVADYPDKRKHFPLASNDVDFVWTSLAAKSVTVETLPGEADQFAYVVFHVVGYDGTCSEPVLGERVTFQIDSGTGIFIDAAGAGSFSNLFADVETFRTGTATVGTAGPDGYKVLPRQYAGECQAWVRISNSLLGVTNVLVTAYDPEPPGVIRFDVVVDFQTTFTYNLVAGWNLIVWMGQNGISPAAALSGGNPNITNITTALYGWVAATQTWLGFFPSGVNVPGANDLTALVNGEAYWIHLTSGTSWTVPTNVGP